MNHLLVPVLLAIELGGGFGTATANITSTTPQSMVVEIRVEVEVEADTVVAHFALPDEDQITIPLLARDHGTYGVTTELKPADYMVVFEAVGETGAQSEPVSLSDLGAELGPEAGGADQDDDERSPETNQWMWLGVALGAASLSALAFWALGGRDESDGDHDADQTPPDGVESAEPSPEMPSPEEPTSED